MSWLSKAVGGNTLKIGVALLAGGLTREYLYGQTTSTMYDTATGTTFSGGYTGQNIFGKTLSTLGVKPFQETAVGQSFVGGFLDYLGPRDQTGARVASDSGLFETATKALTSFSQFQQNKPETPQYSLSGFGVRSDLAFAPGQTQMLPVGRGGQVLAAAERNGQYFAKQVRGMGLPAASRLPSPTEQGGDIQTTSMRRRGLQKLGLG